MLDWKRDVTSPVTLATTGVTTSVQLSRSCLSTYWREPDYTFHPYEYDGYTADDDAYSKKTCLWTSDGFVMPATDAVEDYDDRIHQMSPREDRSEKRSQTPRGFANAVCEANAAVELA